MRGEAQGSDCRFRPMPRSNSLTVKPSPLRKRGPKERMGRRTLFLCASVLWVLACRRGVPQGVGLRNAQHDGGS